MVIALGEKRRSFRMASAVMALACLLVGCATQPVNYFEQVEGKSLPLAGARIAILCGNPGGPSQLYASLVASKFRESGMYDVPTDSYIKRIYKEYPVNIIGNDRYILESDIPHLIAVGKALSVDYLLTLWVSIQENSYNGVKQSFDIVFIGSLLSIEDGEYVGASGFGWRERLPLYDAKAQTDLIVESIQKASDLVYEDMTKKLGMANSSKRSKHAFVGRRAPRTPARISKADANEHTPADQGIYR
jgi:hypothetical protein